jgi:hypothetical protein
MTLHTFTALVRVRTTPNNQLLVNTQVVAEDSYRAIRLLETQYGKGNVIGVPQRAKS